ncbi:YjbQ family protein [bacterium]|nr:YjbQ family protein [candidate division CSSED10-310 bacterium]
MKQISVQTTQRECLIDITSKVSEVVRSIDKTNGICIVFVPHTTAGITINENADPDVKKDIRDTLSRLIPKGANYRHLEGNADSHVKASLVGASVTIMVENKNLMLGTWQGIQFCEFDGPRNRSVLISVF